MGIELRWLVSTAASTLHAAAALCEGRTLVDRKTQGALDRPVQSLRADLASLGIEPVRFFEHAIPASTQLENPAALAEVVVRKVLGRDAAESAAPLLKGRLVALMAAFADANPDALDQLE